MEANISWVAYMLVGVLDRRLPRLPRRQRLRPVVGVFTIAEVLIILILNAVVIAKGSTEGL